MTINDNDAPIRINRQDLETENGKLIFEQNTKSAGRYIKSQGVYGVDAEDLCQEVSVRVLEKLKKDENLAVDAGYFINTAWNVLREYWRKKGVDQIRFVSNSSAEDGEIEQPLDTETRLENFEVEKSRTVSNECFTECFDSLNEADQILFWRYFFDKNAHYFESEEDILTKTAHRPFLESLHEIFHKFNPFSIKYKPMTVNEKFVARVRISRRRKKLLECWKNCILRKKGFE